MTHGTIKGRSFLLATMAPLMLPAALLAACSSSTTPGQAVTGTYTVTFPSVAAAVATNKLQVYVFDESDGSNQCGSLVQKQKAGAQLPATVVASSPVSICSFENASSTSNNLGVPFGTYEVMVVALDATGADFLIGCTSQTFSASQATVSVPLTFASSQTSVPPTSCSSLSQHCSSGCQ